MTVFYQPFDGGADGASIDWGNTEATGAPVYVAGAGTITYTTTNPIHGAASVVASVAAGQNDAGAILGGINTTTMRAHLYFRVPDTIPADGFQVLHAQSGTSTHIVIQPGGSAYVGSWGTTIGQTAPPGTIQAGQTIRASLTIDTAGDTRAALFLSDATTPLWQTSGPSLTTAAVTEIKAGLAWVWSGGPLALTFDDLRVDTDTAAAFLPPESLPSSPYWVREPVGWRRLGMADAIEERFAPPATAGAAPPGAQTRTAPTGAIHVSTSGSDTTGNGTTGAPYATLTAAIAAAPSGGTIVLHAGNHHVGVAVPPGGTGYNTTTLWAGVTGDKANLTIMGAPGEAAWLDGSRTVTGWTAAGSVWETNLTIAHDRSPTGTHNADDSTTANWSYISPDRPLAAWPEQVWIDDTPLRQVATRAEVGPGTFAVEGAWNGKVFTSSRYIIGDNPNGRTVRVVDLATCMSSTGTGFTLRGLGVRRYGASTSQRGAVKLRHADCRIEHVTFDHAGTLSVTGFEAHRAIIDHVTIRSAGMLGMEATESDDLTIRDTLVTDANARGYNHAPEAGGIKLTHQRRPVLARVTVHDSDCHGIWLDESVTNAVIASCDIHWVDGSGIVSELSHGTTVVDCAITAPGSDCIVIFNTSGPVRVLSSTFARPGRLSPYGRCVSVVADDRAPLKVGSVGLDPRFGYPHPDGCDALTVDVTINGNIIGPSAAQGLIWNEDYNNSAGAARNWTAFGLKADGNVHVLRNNKPDWKWVLAAPGSADPTILWNFDDLRTRGLDTTSTVLAGRDYGSGVNGHRTPSAASATGASIPSDLATITGRPAGDTSVGATR